MREVVVLGVGMHPFGRFLDKGLSDLAYVAVWDALKDAGVPAEYKVFFLPASLYVEFEIYPSKGWESSNAEMESGWLIIPPLTCRVAWATRCMWSR